jgi:hypothetical protein
MQAPYLWWAMNYRDILVHAAIELCFSVLITVQNKVKELFVQQIAETDYFRWWNSRYI